MSSSDSWSDRRGLFQRGKEVHQPGRKMSGSGGVMDAVRRASIGSNSGEPVASTTTTESNTSSSGGRRRSSNVPFENLTNLKRGSEDYGERRASHSEMHGTGGYVAGWFNKTFRGMQPATTERQEPVEQKKPQQDPKRGVMEWYERRTDSI